MNPRRSVLFAIVGLGFALLGFIYDLSLAGLPYQDPTPEMQARWVFHGNVAGWITTLGAVILVGAFVLGVLSWAQKERKE